MNHKGTKAQRGTKEEEELRIDLPDPVLARDVGLTEVSDAAALEGMLGETSARIGVGRAGPRPRTASLLRFQADHAVTQDALFQEVSGALVEELGLFSVHTRVSGGRGQYLLRPDLGRQLDEVARTQIGTRCRPKADLQVAIGDGLSAAAVEANVRVLLPALAEGAAAVGLSFGTPFLIRDARVGVLNEIGALLHPQVAVLLIGERPGLGRADALSAYMAYRPSPGQTDADRTVISSIYPEGGTDPLAAAATILELACAMVEHKASGVKLQATY